MNDVDAVIDAQQQVVEMIAGYRARLEAAGFSPTAAESMASQYHWLIMQKQLKGSK